MTYYPGVTVAPASTLESDKGVVGVYRNRGEQLEGFDRVMSKNLNQYGCRGPGA